MQLIDSAFVRAPRGLVLAGGGFDRVDISIRFGVTEDAAGHLVLVDTGYTGRVTQGPRTGALKLYNRLLSPKLVPGSTADAYAARALGRAGALKTVIVTHWHADHVAGLLDFPHSSILCTQDGLDHLATLSPVAALRHGIFTELLPKDLMRRVRLIEQGPLIATGTSLGDGYDLFGDQRLLAIPLPGHAIGHIGLFWRDAGRPTLYATDAAWSLTALMQDRTPWLSRHTVFARPAEGQATAARLRAFAAEGGHIQLCHDIVDARS